MIRQGDCMLIPVDSIPKSAKATKPRENRHILLEGEATGHRHSVAAPDVEMFERDGTIYLKVLTETPLEHQEHAPIVLGLGNYVMRRQREYWEEETRNVMD